MRIVSSAYAVVYIAIVVIFGACAVLLVGFAFHELWEAVMPPSPVDVRGRVVVSLAIECLVAVFGLLHRDPAHLPQAAAIAVAASFLLAAWGLFVRWNVAAERLEPEAMQRAKREDHHVDEASAPTDA